MAERNFPTQSEFVQREPVLSHQLDYFFSLQKQLFQDREVSAEGYIPWVRDFTQHFLLSRINRADDLDTEAIKEARRLSENFFGKDTYHYVLGCMDGRNIPAVMLSHVPHAGGAFMRTAGGDFESFRSSTIPGQVIVEMGSYKAKSIMRLLNKKPVPQIHYSFDSHFACAAMGVREEVAGVVKDGGLAADIRRKKELARGILMIREKMLQEGQHPAEIYPQFFSYDPHDGTITMGLELFADGVGEAGFTPDVLKELSDKKSIVSTWEFLQDERVAEQLRATVKPTDFRNRFADSLLSNWQAITNLYQDGEGYVFKTISRRLYDIYIDAGWTIGEEANVDKQQISHAVLINKAKVMLKNLVTRWSIAEDHNGHDQAGWPFNSHVEQAIIFTEGGYGPFNGIDVFSIFSRGTVVNHAYTALGLIRSARKKGSITDPLGRLDSESFVNAPIMMMNKAIVRGLSTSGWESLSKLDLSQITRQIDWNDEDVMDWTRDNIVTVVRDVLGNHRELAYEGNDQFIIVDAVYELFDRMRQMMFDHRFRNQLIQGKIMVVNMMLDSDRRPRTILPLVV